MKTLLAHTLPLTAIISSLITSFLSKTSSQHSVTIAISCIFLLRASREDLGED